MSHFSQIYQMQLDLNKIVGRDTVNDPDRMTWIYDYAQALEDEVVELKNCINWKWWAKESKEHGQYAMIMDLKNAKIEAIDALHFYMSLIHIIGETDFKFFDDYVKFDDDNIATSLFFKCESFIDTIRMIKSFTKWNDPTFGFLEGRKLLIDCQCAEELKATIRIGWVYLNDIFWLLNMNIDEISNIYKLKHQKNLDRQKNDYSVINKTEDDNNQIKAEI